MDPPETIDDTNLAAGDIGISIGGQWGMVSPIERVNLWSGLRNLSSGGQLVLAIYVLAGID